MAAPGRDYDLLSVAADVLQSDEARSLMYSSPPKSTPVSPGYSARLKPIEGSFGDVVEARETLSDAPSIWLSVNDRLDKHGQSAELGRDEVVELIEQLQWLVDNHLDRCCPNETTDHDHPPHPA